MNFVFLLTDQQRAESLSCYGHPMVKTSNYDRLAAKGTKFEQCHTQAALCGPARCSIFTGLYPHVSGHRTLWNLLKPWESNLFMYLKQAGYQIVTYGKNDLFTKETAQMCTDIFEQKPGTNSGPNPFDFDDDKYYSFLHAPFQGSPDETQDARCIRAGMDFIGQWKRGDAPFMLYLPIILPHPPYGPPQEYYDMYNPDEIPPLRPVCEGKDVPLFRCNMRNSRRLDRLPEDFFRKINAVYLGMNSYVDWMLGQLLNALDMSEAANDTVFILSSDHGDFAGDYGLVEKIHNAALDVMSRVPLLIRTPGGIAGHTVNEPVELLDIMATVLDFPGI